MQARALRSRCDGEATWRRRIERATGVRKLGGGLIASDRPIPQKQGRPLG
ncbi:MAG: hypothetical protein HC812_07020 [Leptolyngbya sp. RL_3_1]|nr:hypothetical protein [Leptolyngbya sp. RL_3_1]